MISVLLCTFNGSRWLPQQLQSLLAQELQPSELVVCDDGSTDNTINLLDDFRSKAPFPVQIYRNKQNIGYTLNFLRGIHLTKQSLVAFCDQDDIWLPQKLALSLSVMRDTSSLLVAHGFDLIDREGKRLGSTFDHTGPLLPDGYRLGPVNCAGFSLLLDKNLLNYAPFALSHENYSSICQPGEAPPVGHDALLCDLASCLNAGAFIAKPLVLHRLHGKNTSREKSREGEVSLNTSLITKAVARWKQRHSGHELYSAMSSQLGKEAKIYANMAQELIASGHVVEHLTNKIRLIKLRERDNFLRASLYARKTSGLLGFFKMLLQGCYAASDGHLGPLNAIKDFLYVTTTIFNIRSSF